MRVGRAVGLKLHAQAEERQGHVSSTSTEESGLTRGAEQQGRDWLGRMRARQERRRRPQFRMRWRAGAPHSITGDKDRPRRPDSRKSLGRSSAEGCSRVQARPLLAAKSAQQLVGQDRHDRLSVENVDSRPSVDLRCWRPPTAGKVLEAKNSKLIDISLAICRLFVSFEAASVRGSPGGKILQTSTRSPERPAGAG